MGFEMMMSGATQHVHTSRRGRHVLCSEEAHSRSGDTPSLLSSLTATTDRRAGHTMTNCTLQHTTPPNSTLVSRSRLGRHLWLRTNVRLCRRFMQKYYIRETLNNKTPIDPYTNIARW